MSTIADYSVFTKAFLASTNVDFSKLYTNLEGEGKRAFAVIPFYLETPLTPREAMNFDTNNFDANHRFGENVDFSVTSMENLVSCYDADRNFIGNIVRVQPSKRDGSIRLVAKVAVPAFMSSEGGTVDTTDTPFNTFVLVRTDASTGMNLPIAVATISKGYNLHRHLASGNVPLDDVENANYVSFTINNLNGYTSVDFNPDAYATYDDVANALSRGIDGLHIAFNSNTGDIILSDSKGNVIDQANLHLDLSTDTIIAEGEEGYKYVKTDRNQDIHSAKAFMAPPGKDGSYDSAFGGVGAVLYETKHASLVRFAGDDTHVCNGIRVRWAEPAQEGSEQATQHDEIYWVGLAAWSDAEGAPRDHLALNCSPLQDGRLGNATSKFLRTASGTPIEVTGDSSIYSGDPIFDITKSVYYHDAFVHTVGNSSLADWDECFTLMGFHDGDDIPLGTDLPALMKALTEREGKVDGYLDPEAWIHGADADNAAKVVTQRDNAKKELVAWNAQHPELMGNWHSGTIIDSTGLDVRDGRITLGCGRVGDAGVYGIQMKDRSQGNNISGSLDFTISHSRGEVQFDENGHAVQSGNDGGLVPLTSSTLLSIEAGSYISGAPTCLILAKVSRSKGGTNPEGGSPNPPEGSPVLTPVRMTAGFSVAQNYDASSGLRLTLQDLRENISAVFNPNHYKYNPAIIEVQAIYTYPAASNDTVPAQQMHTYIGTWLGEQQPNCSFLCNKIEEWMTAIDLPNTLLGVGENDPKYEIGLYVVIRVY